MPWNLNSHELFVLIVHVLFVVINALLNTLQTWLDVVGARVTSGVAAAVSISIIVPLVLHARGTRARERGDENKRRRTVQRMLPREVYEAQQAINDLIAIEMESMGLR